MKRETLSILRCVLSKVALALASPQISSVHYFHTWVLTEVKHGWNKSPSDDKLAALEQLLQPLFGLFAHFSHVSISNSEDSVTLRPRTR